MKNSQQNLSKTKTANFCTLICQKKVSKKSYAYLLEVFKIASVISAGENKALRYLQTWEESQDDETVSWKFEKCRQIWLLQNAFDTQKISDDKFDILLKYMCSIKGHMRDTIKGKLYFKMSCELSSCQTLTKSIPIHTQYT